MALENHVASMLCGFVRLITSARALWVYQLPPDRRSRIYFANHNSHGDFILIWASLPEPLRRLARPVAAADYWLKGALRRYLIQRVFRAVLIDRSTKSPDANPVADMGKALTNGDSLILFPEGTRNQGDGLLPFKSGIYHLAKDHPMVELVPIWIENLRRVMPKGALIPAPLLCTLIFGEPLHVGADEEKNAFLSRASAALLALAPPAE